MTPYELGDTHSKDSTLSQVAALVTVAIAAATAEERLTAFASLLTNVDHVVIAGIARLGAWLAPAAFADLGLVVYILTHAALVVVWRLFLGRRFRRRLATCHLVVFDDFAASDHLVLLLRRWWRRPGRGWWVVISRLHIAIQLVAVISPLPRSRPLHDVPFDGDVTFLVFSPRRSWRDDASGPLDNLSLDRDVSLDRRTTDRLRRALTLDDSNVAHHWFRWRWGTPLAPYDSRLVSGGRLAVVDAHTIAIVLAWDSILLDGDVGAIRIGATEGRPGVVVSRHLAGVHEMVLGRSQHSPKDLLVPHSRAFRSVRWESEGWSQGNVLSPEMESLKCGENV